MPFGRLTDSAPEEARGMETAKDTEQALPGRLPSRRQFVCGPVNEGGEPNEM